MCINIIFERINDATISTVSMNYYITITSIMLMNHWQRVSFYRETSHWWSNELPFQFIRWSEKKDLMVIYPEATILILTWSQLDFNSLWWYLYSGLTRFSGIAYCIFLNNSKKRDGRYHYVNDPAILNVYKKCQNVCSNYVEFFDSIIDYKLMKKSCTMSVFGFTGCFRL